MRRRSKHRRHLSTVAAAVKDAGNTSPTTSKHKEDDGDTVKTTRRSNSKSQRSKVFKPKLDNIQTQSQILKMWDIEEVSTVVSSETQDDVECAEISSCSGTNSSEREEDIFQAYTEEAKRPPVSKRDDKSDVNSIILSTLCAAIENAQLYADDGTEIEITLENAMACTTAIRPEPANFLQKLVLDCSCTKQHSIPPPGVVARIKINVIPPNQVYSAKERSSNISSD
jgi:hypothetical protein